MTENRHIRENQRTRCGKCGAPGRWGEACIMCGAVYTSGATRQPTVQPTAYILATIPRLRVAHGSTCTAEGEPHKCHCGGGVTHPCNCYEN